MECWYSSMGMKHLLAFLLFLSSALCLSAANPSFKAFIGTNGTVIVSNTSTDKIIIGPAQSEVWTNRGTSISVSPAISTIGKPLIIGDGIANPASGNIGSIYSYSNTTNKSDVEFYRNFITGSSTLTGGDEHDLIAGPAGFSAFSAVHGYWYTELTNAGGLFGGLDFSDRSGVYGLVSELAALHDNSTTDFGGETMGFMVYNHGTGKRNTSIGVHSQTSSSLSGVQTNIGIAVAMQKNGSGPYTGIYVEAYDGSLDSFGPNYQPAIAIFDSRKTGLSILQARATNGAFIPLEVTALKVTNAVPLDVAYTVTAPQANFFPLTVSGAGNGNTNYTLLASRRKMYLGSSNVNVAAVMQTVAGQVQFCSVSVTNLSADTWGFNFSQVTNRVRWRDRATGTTNQPTVLTNNTELRVEFEFNGTNGLATYEYFRPGL
jgi:hypothetical protein